MTAIHLIAVAIVAAAGFAGCVQGPSGPNRPVDAKSLSGLSYDAETTLLLRGADVYDSLAAKLDSGEIASAPALLTSIGEADRATRDTSYAARDKAFGDRQYAAKDVWLPKQAAAALRELAAGRRRRAGK